MSLLKFFGLGSKPTPQPIAPKGPLGLGKDSLVCIDQDLNMLFDGVTEVAIPSAQACVSDGVVDLGQSTWLTRLYLDDEDYWVQLLSSGSRNSEPDAIVLFNYLSCVSVNSEAELKDLAGPSSNVGLPTYTHNGKTYEREWGAADGQTELIELIEQVTTANEFYDVKHRSMLYTRETGLSDRKEFLLFSVEEDHEGGISFSTSLGITLNTTDLKSI